MGGSLKKKPQGEGAVEGERESSGGSHESVLNGKQRPKRVELPASQYPNALLLLQTGGKIQNPATSKHISFDRGKKDNEILY